METIRYRVNDPYDFIPRALDYLRKSGFKLHGLRVEPNPDSAAFHIRLDVLATTDASLLTFHHRSLNIMGALSVSCAPASKQTFSEA